MLLNSQMSLLRVALLSKGTATQSYLLPSIKQAIFSVKAENRYDPINNLSLLISLTGVLPKFNVVNQKHSLVLPRVVLSGPALKLFLELTMQALVVRLSDKTVSINYGVDSTKVTFAFKASDAITPEMIKLWKLFSAEAGMFSFEITLVSTNNSPLNESLFRGYQLPVFISQ
jgi:hypothetical protein